MTDAQINRAIAEACGWEKVQKEVDVDTWPSIATFWRHPVLQPTLIRCTYPVDYCNDLNAMHEAEKLLNEIQLFRYKSELEVLCGLKFPFHATARQRAEAFLRTLGKCTRWIGLSVHKWRYSNE